MLTDRHPMVQCCVCVCVCVCEVYTHCIVNMACLVQTDHYPMVQYCVWVCAVYTHCIVNMTHLVLTDAIPWCSTLGVCVCVKYTHTALST